YSVLTLSAVSAGCAIAVIALLSGHTFAQQGAGVDGISDAAMQQIADILTSKASFTPDQAKLDSNLVFAVKAAAGDPAAASLADIASLGVSDLDAYVNVDVYGSVSQSLIDTIEA